MSKKIQSADLAVAAAIAISTGHDPAEAVAPLIVDHKDPSNLLTRTVTLLESRGVPTAQLHTLNELRRQFNSANLNAPKGTKGAKPIQVDGSKNFKVQVVNGRAFLRLPVDQFASGQLAVLLQDMAGTKEEKRARIPAMNVHLYQDENGLHMSVGEKDDSSALALESMDINRAPSEGLATVAEDATASNISEVNPPVSDDDDDDDDDDDVAIATAEAEVADLLGEDVA